MNHVIPKILIFFIMIYKIQTIQILLQRMFNLRILHHVLGLGSAWICLDRIIWFSWNNQFFLCYHQLWWWYKMAYLYSIIQMAWTLKWKTGMIFLSFWYQNIGQHSKLVTKMRKLNRIQKHLHKTIYLICKLCTQSLMIHFIMDSD